MPAVTQKIVLLADDQTGAAIRSALNNTQKLDKQVQKTSSTMRTATRQSRAAFGQLGHQVQDVAVQVQMGMNPLMVLGQQGSQMASIFGPGGAVAGAFIALGSIAAAQLAPALFEATDAATQLENANKKLDRVVSSMKGGVIELTEEIRELAKANLELAQLELSLGMVQAQAAVEAATKAISTSLDTLMSGFLDNKSLKSFKTDIQTTFNSSSTDAEIASRRINGALSTLAENLGINKKQAKQLTGALIEFSDNTTKEGIEKLQNFLVQFAKEVDITDEQLRTLVISLIDNSEAALKAVKTQEKLKEVMELGSAGFKDNKEASKQAKEELAAFTKSVEEHLSMRDKHIVRDQKLLQLERDLAKAREIMDHELEQAIENRIALHKEELAAKAKADDERRAKRILAEQRERNQLLFNGLSAMQKMAAEQKRLIDVIGEGERGLGDFNSTELAAYTKAMEEFHEEVYGERTRQRAKKAREDARKLEEARRKLAQQDEEAAKIMREMAPDREKFIAFQEKINHLVRNHGLSLEAANKALAEAAEEYGVVNTALRDVGEQGLRSFEDGLVDIVSGAKSAKDAFADMARSIINDLIRMQIQQRITGPLNNTLTSFLTPASPTAVGNMPNAQMTRAPIARAMGGPVSAGRPYMVGERGPELMIPSSSGRVVSNDRLGGDTVNISLNVSTGVSATVRQEMQDMLPQIAEVAKSAVRNAHARRRM
tara:strand:+ start:8907 stop:11054 length:2148 start_codon:yes stop_codon:yes gene_type:complete